MVRTLTETRESVAMTHGDTAESKEGFTALGEKRAADFRRHMS